VLTGSFQEQDDVEFEPLPDYYSLLQVSPTAKTQEIKKNFRKLAMKYHPDKNKDEKAQEIFQELSEAYSILSDSEKRKDYDELFLDEEELAEQYSDQSHPPQTPSSDDDTTAKSPDQDFAEEKTEETTEKSTTAGDKSEDGSKEAWGDLDDETLYKVLKFLADNDYVISKKTTKTESSQHDYKAHNHDRSTRYRRSAEFNEYTTDDQIHYRYQANGQRYKPYARPNHEYDYDERYARARQQSYCRTSVRWEGGVKVTNRSCY